MRLTLLLVRGPHLLIDHNFLFRLNQRGVCFVAILICLLSELLKLFSRPLLHRNGLDSYTEVLHSGWAAFFILIY